MRWTGTNNHRRLTGVTIFVLALLATSTMVAFAQSGPSHSGATFWTEPGNFSQAGDLVANQPVLLCDPLQNTHMFWVARTDQQASIYYSTDASGTWREPVDILVAPSVNLFDAAITPDLQVHLVWVSGVIGDLMYTAVPLAEAFDTRKWPEPMMLDTDVSAMSEVYAGSNTIYADSSGVLHLVYSKRNDSGGFSNSLYYMRSNDSGATWSPPTLITMVNAPEPAKMSGNIVVDGKGRLHVAWDVRSDQYGSFSRLGYIRSTDGGATWGSELDLGTGKPPFGAAMAAVFAYGDDEIHLTWDVPERLHRWSNDGGATWSGIDTVVTLGAAYGGFNKLVKDSAGTLHAISAVKEGVFHEVWNGGGWSAPEQIESTPFDPHGQQLVVCQGNRLHVAYFDRTADQEVWYATKTTGAPALARRPIPPAGSAVARPAAATPTTRPTPSAAAVAVAAPAGRDAGGLFAAEPAPASGTANLAPLVGAAVSALLVGGVVAVTLSRRQR